MSYSISGKAATKDALLADLAEKMNQVVAQQPVHAKDQTQALAAADGFLRLLPDEPLPGKQFAVSMSGSITMTDDTAISAGVNVYAGFADADAPQAAEAA